MLELKLGLGVKFDPENLLIPTVLKRYREVTASYLSSSLSHFMTPRIWFSKSQCMIYSDVDPIARSYRRLCWDGSSYDWIRSQSRRKCYCYASWPGVPFRPGCTVWKDRLLVLKLDVKELQDIIDGFAKAKEVFGRIDVVFNNAGYGTQVGDFCVIVALCWSGFLIRMDRRDRRYTVRPRSGLLRGQFLGC